jgi:hypothetical protein
MTIAVLSLLALLCLIAIIDMLASNDSINGGGSSIDHSGDDLDDK